MSEELSLSEELRHAREARGETLEQVHQRTGISLTVLRELESGDYSVVEPVYARLAINHYASHLGLDGVAFETRLRSEVAATRPPPVVMRTTEHPSIQSLPRPSPVAELIRSQPPSRLATIGVILVVGLAIVLYLLGSDTPDVRGTSHRPPPVSRPVVTAPLVPAQSAPAQSAPAQSAPAQSVPAQSVPAQSGTAATDSRPSPPLATTPLDVAISTALPATPTEAISPGAAEAVPEVETRQDSAITAATPVPALTATDLPPAAEMAPAVAGDTATPLESASPETAVTTPLATVVTPVDSVASSNTATVGTTVTPSGSLVLQIDAVDSTWVQVQWDDNDGVVEIIPSGQRRIWGAERFFLVRAGRAHGVHFHFQGQLLGDGRLGDPRRSCGSGLRPRVCSSSGPTWNRSNPSL
ncbi:MAG: helix-turn-helix domain-containing protein [bacterium]|nr:helix-turn-helix domain-containing protein [bacterium]